MVFLARKKLLKKKNHIVAERHSLRQELSAIEDTKEEALFKTVLQVVEMFAYIPYRYKELNPLIKRKLLNFLFVNQQLHGSCIAY